MINLYVVGYPRSGNTWLGYLLSDVLGCAYAANDRDRTFAGDKTAAPYVVHKSHRTTTPDLARTIFIYRNPRDVAVSVAHYLERSDLLKAIHDMTRPIALWGVGSYLDFIKAWWYPLTGPVMICYSELHESPYESITRILIDALGYAPTHRQIETALTRQSLPRLQARYNSRDFRKGLIGEWKACFTVETAQLFDDLFGTLLRDQGFATDERWIEQCLQIQSVLA